MTKSEYSPDEVREILRRATQGRDKSDANSLSRDELIEAAREAGLDADAVARAADEVSESRALDAHRASMAGVRRRELRAHATVYLLANLAIVALGVLFATKLWAIVTLGWAVALLMHANVALRRPSDDEVRDALEVRALEERARRAAIQAEESRLLLLEEKQAKISLSASQEQARDALVSALDKSVEAAMRTAAKKLETLAERLNGETQPAKSESEFGKYVAQKKGKTPAASVARAASAEPTQSTGVRVESSTSGTPSREVREELQSESQKQARPSAVARRRAED
ncbi:MAG: 2TM domain-containing protein [Deltaproteobacteria bacterium]|nr:2TM domain-containing protein [Deltaproteobacteria bacterium]